MLLALLLYSGTRRKFDFIEVFEDAITDLRGLVGRVCRSSRQSCLTSWMSPGRRESWDLVRWIWWEIFDTREAKLSALEVGF